MQSTRLPALPSGARLHVTAPGWTGKLGTGGRVWPGAAAMCQLLLSMRASVAGSNVLELGCGTGAVGVYAGALGASRVLLTDGNDEETSLAALNARRHKYLFDPGARVDAQVYRWGGPTDVLEAGGRFDWVIGADITYSVEALPPLCDTFAALSHPKDGDGRQPRMLLSHQVNRCGESEIPRILALVAEGRGLLVRPFESATDISAPNVAIYQVVNAACDEHIQ